MKIPHKVLLNMIAYSDMYLTDRIQRANGMSKVKYQRELDEMKKCWSEYTTSRNELKK